MRNSAFGALVGAALTLVVGCADAVKLAPGGPPSVASVAVSLGASSLIVGQNTQASVTVRDSAGNVLSGRTVAWSSSGSAASVGADGAVTAVATGTVNIVATVEGKTGSAPLTIVPVPPVPVATVTTTLASSTLTAGQTTQATAVTRDASNNILTGRTIVWSSSNTAVATVNGSGLVTAVAAGSANVVASAEGKTGGATLTVNAPPPAPVATVSVSLAASSLTVGQTTQATATPRDASNNVLTGRTVAWSSSNTGVATVSASGVVTAVAAGSANIVATVETKTGSAAVSVTAPTATVASVTVTLNAASINVGQTTQATAVARDASGNVITGRAVTWSSSNTAVATVNGSGLASGVAAGSANVRATVDGVVGSTALTVTAQTATGCANAPAGTIWCDDFEQDRTGSYYEYASANGSFTRVAGAGRNGGTGMRAHFAAGQVDAGSLKLAFGRTPSSTFRPVDAGTANYRDVYWRFYFRNQAGWTGGGGDKMSRATIFAAANWAQAAIAHVWSGGQSSNWNYLLIEPASGTDPSGTLITTTYNDFAHLRWLGPAQSATALFSSANVGQWYCIEARMRVNDPGQSNGVFQLWINGNSDATISNLNWIGSYQDYGINAIFLENYWNAGSPQAQDRFFDDFIVSTQRIGCN